MYLSYLAFEHLLNLFVKNTSTDFADLFDTIFLFQLVKVSSCCSVGDLLGELRKMESDKKAGGVKSHYLEHGESLRGCCGAFLPKKEGPSHNHNCVEGPSRVLTSR